MSILNIETKENSPEKLAAVAGKDTKFFLMAEEFNEVVEAINDNDDKIGDLEGDLPGKEDKSNKGVANGYAPLNSAIKIASEYLSIVNDLVTGGVSSLLSAEQGKVLKAQINAINTLLTSDNVNLDTLQELVDAIETVQTSLGTILVNDLTTGGTTKALTAEMGKLLQNNKENIANKAIDFSIINDDLYPTVKAVKDYLGANVAALGTGSTVFFTNVIGIIYNRDSPSSSNITFDFTGAKIGAVSSIFHNSSTIPTFNGGTNLFISGQYKVNTTNLIWFCYLGSSKTMINIQNMQNLSAPTGFTFVKVDNTHINLSWDNNGYNYTLQRASLADFSDASTIYTGSTASYSDTVPSPNIYYYRLKSTYSGAIDSLYVNIQATTLFSGLLTFVAGPNNLLTSPSTGVYSTSSSTSYAAYGNSDYKIPSGLMGYIDIKVPNSAKEGSVICLATSNISGGYASSKFAFLLGQGLSAVSVFLNGTYVTDVASGYVTGANAKFRMIRLANGNCELYKSSDSIIFTLVYTFSAAYTGDMWIVINPKNTTTEVNNPNGFNLIDK